VSDPESEESGVSEMKDFALRSINHKEIHMTEQSAPSHRILKIVTCPSLSQRASLTYHVGCDGKGDVCFRIWDTSGRGIFSKEWVCATDIHKVLAQHKLLAAPLLLPLFNAGRSVNTAGFLLAALKNEGLVALSEKEPHKYVRQDPLAFVGELTALMKSSVSLDESAHPAIQKRRRGARAPAWDLDAPAAS
jgi:hypothetical protein